MNYKNQLKAYSKKLFDPFCRRERISFQIPGPDAFLTTVGQLNFFRWALEKGILDYIKGHQPEIEKEMNTAMKEQTKQKQTRDSTVSTATTSTTATIVTVASASSASAASSATQTRKRTANRETAAIKLLQKHDCEIVMKFE
jgi:activator of HSP90 ATPase